MTTLAARKITHISNRWVPAETVFQQHAGCDPAAVIELDLIRNHVAFRNPEGNLVIVAENDSDSFLPVVLSWNRGRVKVILEPMSFSTIVLSEDSINDI
jgi:hypothetical protein